MAINRAIVAITLCILRIGRVHSQAAGRDLPSGFRSIAGVTVNRDSAVTIRAKLGPTRERRLGTGAVAHVSWCYVPTGGSPGTLLELLSDASDMGTSGRALTAIRLRAEAPPEDRNGCASLQRAVELSTPTGLRLGLTLKDIEGLLGVPRRRVVDSLAYYFDAKEYLRSGTPEFEAWNTPERRESCFDAGLPYASVGATITIALRHGRAVDIRIERNDQSIC